jgi:hypothetical protein
MKTQTHTQTAQGSGPSQADAAQTAQGSGPSRADAALIAESCRDPEVFGLVFDRHAAAIHGYIARRLGPDPADDLVAETFLVAFRQRGGYDRAPAWLPGQGAGQGLCGDRGSTSTDGPRQLRVVGHLHRPQ